MLLLSLVHHFLDSFGPNIHWNNINLLLLTSYFLLYMLRWSKRWATLALLVIAVVARVLLKGTICSRPHWLLMPFVIKSLVKGLAAGLVLFNVPLVSHLLLNTRPSEVTTLRAHIAGASCVLIIHCMIIRPLIIVAGSKAIVQIVLTTTLVSLRVISAIAIHFLILNFN